MKSIFDKVVARLPRFTSRLTEERRPPALPPGLRPDDRGLALLELFGPANMRQFVDEILHCEATEGGTGIGPDFLGFIEDYYRIAQFVSKLDIRTVIVDVGCCAGLQQVFFSDFIGYIGIDRTVPSATRPLQSNARFIQGDFATLVKRGEFVITDNMFGIANMSLLYLPEEESAKQAAVFKRFKRMVIA